MQTVEITITARQNFTAAVNAARKAGGRFNPATKTWAIPANCHNLNAPGAYGWKIVSPRVDPATTYVGQSSMDAEDSIF